MVLVVVPVMFNCWPYVGSVVRGYVLLEALPFIAQVKVNAFAVMVILSEVDKEWPERVNSKLPFAGVYVAPVGVTLDPPTTWTPLVAQLMKLWE